VSAPFAFRLERVRALRERSESEAKEAYAQVLAARLRGAAHLEAQGTRLHGARDAQRATLAGPVDAATLLAHQAFLERTERGQRAAELDLHRRDAELSSASDALVRAARERQVLERLKERRRAEHARAAEQREAAVIDELALAVHRRRGGAG
jgi:flagellar FliJ protein